MVGSSQHGRVGTPDHTQVGWLGSLWPWYIALVMLLMSSGLPGSLDAAERTRAIRIGALTDAWGPTPHMAGLRAGLLELGYRERKDFVIGVRFTQGNHALLPAAARDLVRYGVDLIFVTSAEPAKAAQQATTQIPIVFAWVEDPVGLDLVQSFARPGGNITGVATLTIELAPKRLEVFLELVPSLKRVLYLYDANDSLSKMAGVRFHEAARRLQVVLVEKAVRTEEEAQATLAQLRKDEMIGIMSPITAALNIVGFLLETSSKQGIPTMFDIPFMVEQGGLASYGPSSYELGRQAGRLVDKIIKGASPAEIPVETNSNIEFAINLKTAKALGLTIAPEVLFQANRLIR